MTMLAVVVFGYISAGQLKVELLPDLSYPTLTVQTEYVDAAPVSVEQFITRPVEEALGVIPGVRDMRSTSRSGLSEVTLEFDWDEQMDFAAIDVREKLGTVYLPREAERPRVLRFDPALDPVVRLAFGGERSSDELWQLAERWLKPRFEAITGVAAAKVRGGREPEYQIEVDQDRLATMGLELDDLAAALRASNINIPGGSVKDFGAVYLVRTLNEYDDIEKIRRTVVRDAPTGRVRVEDVAEVRRGHRDREVITHSQGAEIVELALHREGSANTIEVAAAIRAEIELLAAELPEDLSLELLADQSVYIANAIDEVWWAAILGGIIAIVVLYFFLRDPWATVIIALTIPISVLTAFLLLRRADVTLNIMSLGGLALGVGMLVDNSIVVLEAIDRRRRAGEGRAGAAAKGAGEVAGAVTAATLTTLSVFLPIVFVSGVAGQLFYDLAVTVCISLGASLLVSLTLIPSLASWTGAAAAADATLFLWDAPTGAQRPWTLRLGPVELTPIGDGQHLISRVLTLLFLLPRLILALAHLLVIGLGGFLLRIFDLLVWPLSRALDKVGAFYPGVLQGAVRARWVVLPLTLLVFLLALLAVPQLGTQLVPDLSQGAFSFRLRLAEGTPLESTAEVVERMETLLVGDERIERLFSVMGTLPSAASGRQERGENLAQLDFVLRPDASAVDEAAAIARVREVLALFPNIDAELNHPSVLSLRPPVAVRLYSDDLDALDLASAAMVPTLAAMPELRDVATTSEPGSPEIRVELNRERAAALGIQAEAISRNLRLQIHGEVVGQFREEEERIDIRLRADERYRSRASELKELQVPLPDGNFVPISAFADILIDRGPAAIHRVGGARVVEVTAQASVTDLGATLAAVRAYIADADLPVGVTAELAGQDEELRASFDNLRFTLLLAVFLVYVVMAVQFESLVHPFVVLLAVPLGLVGVVAILFIVNMSVSVLVLIGLVMLAGIVVNNAIVLVDAINRRRHEGAGLEEAIRGAGRERLRPILMTTTTTVLALAPMALGLGAGAELRAPLALTVIGGLLGATLLTLIVTPCLYRVLTRSGDVREKEEERAAVPS